MTLQIPELGRKFDSRQTIKEGRFKAVVVSLDIVGTVFADTPHGPIPQFRITGGVPPDAVCVGVEFRQHEARLVLAYTHPSFTVVPHGQPIPVLGNDKVVVTRVSDD